MRRRRRQFSVYVGPSARGRKITIAGKRLREEAGGGGGQPRVSAAGKGQKLWGRGKETDGWKEGKNRRNGWRETEIYMYIYIYIYIYTLG